MHERERYQLATIAAETMCNLWELSYQQEELNLDQMMRRLKDLSAYSLTHAEIMDQREGVELLALARFFGMSSDPQFQENQERLRLLSEQTMAYQGKAEIIEQEVQGEKRGWTAKRLCIRYVTHWRRICWKMASTSGTFRSCLGLAAFARLKDTRT
jgi:hypothetical protein